MEEQSWSKISCVGGTGASHVVNGAEHTDKMSEMH